MPSSREPWSRRDSWPPTQVRLQPTVSTKDAPLPSLDDIDNDPLTYFLTPAPELGDDDDDLDAVMLDFDAGIEDSKHPRDVVRSVSPSTLDGLRKPGLPPPSRRSASPDATGSENDADNENDNDEEDYIRFSPSGLLALHDVADRPRSPAHLAPVRGRGRGRQAGMRIGSGAGPVRRYRAGQLWREPSPDVWSIEEETEEELMSDMGSSVAAPSEAGDGEENHEHGGVRLGKAAGKKRVRFVLPAKID